MNTIKLIACISMIVGCFILIGIKPLEFADGFFAFLTKERPSLRRRLGIYQGRKKENALRRLIKKTDNVLSITGKEGKLPLVLTASLALFAVGASSAILAGNPFLVPVLGISFMSLPFLYIGNLLRSFNKSVAMELETALSVITTAYLRSENLILAIEENTGHLNPPVKSVFENFLLQVHLINPDVSLAIRKMKGELKNEVFGEWCDALLSCQHDRSLKSTLTPILSKLSDMRIVNSELEYLVFEPRKEFITMVILVLGNIPLMYFLNKDWYDILMHTVIGQLILAITATLIFVSTIFVLRITKPLEYRR